MKMKGYALLNNVAFLYFVFFVSLINLFGFMYNKDYQSVFLFSCTALIVYVFNNNMIVVLLISLIFVNLLIFLNRLNISTMTIEGFDEVAETSKEEPKGVDKDTPLTNITLGNILTTSAKVKLFSGSNSSTAFFEVVPFLVLNFSLVFFSIVSINSKNSIDKSDF